MKNQGQLSLEFMLVLVVSIAYVNAIIIPNIDFGRDTINEIYGLGQAKLAAQKLANTVNSLSVQSSDAKQTIAINLPKNAKINCVAVTNQIELTYYLTGEPSDLCQEDIPSPPGTGKKTKCITTIPTKAGTLLCNPPAAFPIIGPTLKTLIITTNGTTVTVSG